MFPSRLQTPGRWEEHGCHIINDFKNPSFLYTCFVSFSVSLALTLSLSYIYTPHRSHRHTAVSSWDHYTDILRGCHTDRNPSTCPGAFVLRLSLLSERDLTSEIPGYPFPLLHAMKIILTQQHGFQLLDGVFSHYELFFSSCKTMFFRKRDMVLSRFYCTSPAPQSVHITSVEAQRDLLCFRSNDLRPQRWGLRTMNKITNAANRFSGQWWWHLNDKQCLAL